MLSERENAHTVNIFFCNDPKDEEFYKRLSAHFSTMRRQGRIHTWGLSDIHAGENRNEKIDGHLYEADIILLLVSSDFINSDECHTITQRAIERSRAGEARTIPILAKPVDISEAHFYELEMLPKGHQPITCWSDCELAYSHITSEIRNIVNDIHKLNDALNDARQKHYFDQVSLPLRPYRGLQPYSEQDASLFFGRDTYILDLIHRLSSDKRLLLLLGPIGSGKTSVIQAGLVPLLREGSRILPRSFTWEIMTFTPGEHPFSQLTSRLSIYDTKDLTEGIKIWRQLHSEREHLVLVIDQFEELFKLAKPEEQQYFVAQLLKIIIYDLATVIIIMNDLYYSHLAEFDDFIEQAEQHISNIPQLNRDEITAIISQPAKSVNLSFANNLVAKIADDTMKSTKESEELLRSRQSAVLPALSVCLQQLASRQKDHCVTFEDYEVIGGLSGSFTLWASEAFNKLDEKQQTLARRIFIDLIALGDDSEGRFDCRRKKLLTKLCLNSDEAQAVQDVVEILAQAHLLETQWIELQNDYEVQIIHEVLLREWDLLKHWLREDHYFLVWYRNFEHHVQEWLNSHNELKQRDTAFLLRGRLLTEAQRWLEEQSYQFSREAQDFVLASVFFQEQEEQQKKAFLEIQSRQHIALAKQLATKALLIQAQDPRALRKSLLLAVEALRQHHCIEADQALRQGLALLPRLHSRIHMMTGKKLLFSGSGHSLATAGTRGVSWIYHLDSAEEVAETFLIGNTPAIALSYNGEYLLAGVSTGIAWFIDTVNIWRVAMIRNTTPIHCVALTQKEPYSAAIGCENGIIYIYQLLKNNQPITSISQDVPLQNATLLHSLFHGQAVSSLVFSHDERYIVSGGKNQIVRVWSRGGSCIDEHVFEKPILSVVFGPDDTIIAVVSEDGKAFLWQWGQKTHKMWNRKHNDVIRIPQMENIHTIAFSPDGGYLATASIDGFTRIWNLSDMTEAKVYDHNGPVSSVCYHQTEGWMATVSADGNARVYNTIDGQPKHIIPHDTSILAIALSPNKPYLATAENNECVWIWQLNNGSSSTSFCHSGKIVHFAFDTESGKNILRFVTEEMERIKIWAISPEYSLDQIYEFEQVSGWSVSNNGRWLATPQDKIKARLFSFDANSIVDITIDGTINVKNASTQKILNTFTATGDVGGVTISQGGDYIAFTDSQDQIFIWEWRERNCEPTLLGIIKEVRKLAFGGNDQYLIVVDNTKSILIWQWRSQAREARCQLSHEGYIHTLSLSPDQRYLLTTGNDRSARVWDVMTGSLIHYLTHTGVVLLAIFDLEGKYIATASSDHTVGIWNVSTGEQLASLPHDDNVHAMTFSNDGRFLATASINEMIRIWTWQPDDLEAEARSRLLGNLTHEEWQEYIGNEPYQETFVDLGWHEIPQYYPFGEE